MGGCRVFDGAHDIQDDHCFDSTMSSGSTVRVVVQSSRKIIFNTIGLSGGSCGSSRVDDSIGDAGCVSLNRCA